MKKQNQKGFSAIEGLLSLIAVALIVFVGYYIYHAQSKTTDTYNSSTEVAGTTVPQGTVKKVSSSTANEFTIKEWGVEAPYSGNLTLTYAITNDNPGADAAFTSSQLSATDPECASGANYGGVITRYASTDIVPTADGSSGDTPAKYVVDPQYNSSNSDRIYSHVGNYYYLYTSPQSGCGDTQASRDAQAQTQSAVEAITKGLKAIN